MDQTAFLAGRLGIKATFECRDAEGNIVKLIHLEGGVPLSTPAEVEAAQQLIQEANSGSDDCK